MSRVDIDREGDTYTVDTLRDLHKQLPDAQLYFITGADALESILSWQDWEELFDLARFVGVSRPGYKLDATHLAKHLEQLPADTLTLLEIPALSISSRSAVRGGPGTAGLVPGARRRRAVHREAEAVSCASASSPGVSAPGAERAGGGGAAPGAERAGGGGAAPGAERAGGGGAAPGAERAGGGGAAPGAERAGGADTVPETESIERATTRK